MDKITSALTELFDRIPRRHNPDNVKEIYGILDDYESLLQEIEGTNDFYEKNIAEFFDAIDPIRLNIKKSSDGKASKKQKDELFDQGSGDLKDSIESLISFYDNGSKN